VKKSQENKLHIGIGIGASLLITIIFGWLGAGDATSTENEEGRLALQQ